jgi:ATP-binding cassette subfamily F protein 3
MEEDLSSIESELTTPEGASNVSLLQSYIDLKNKITISMNIWEKLTLEMEKLQNNQ